MSTPNNAGWYIGFPNESSRNNDTNRFVGHDPVWYVGYNASPALTKIDKLIPNINTSPLALVVEVNQATVDNSYPNTQPTQTPTS